MKTFKQLREEVNEACWKGYKQVGGKMKNGKMVPNCVPVKEAANAAQQAAIAIAMKKAGKKPKNEEVSPMIKPPNRRFDNKSDAFAHVKKHGGKVYKGTYIDPNNGTKHISFHVKEEVEQIDEAFINGREYASHGLMHPKHAGEQIHQPSDRYVDFYASGTGDKMSGKVKSNNGKVVQIQAHPKLGDGKLHKFRVTANLPKMTNEAKEEVINERGEDSKGYKRSTESGAGLTRKGAKHFGIKTAVTTPPSKLDPNGKAAKRRKSFCARMSGMKGPMKDDKGRPTRKAMSLRRWNCHE